jgi:hypothetical protein
MTDDVTTGSATVSVDVSMLPAEDSGYVDDDDEDDEINQHVQGVLGYFPSESLRIQQGKSAKFGYLPMTVATLGVLTLSPSVSVSCLVSSWLCLTYT